MSDILDVYMTASNIKASNYSKRQLHSARAAYDFIIKMGFINYKAAAEVVQRVVVSLTLGSQELIWSMHKKYTARLLQTNSDVEHTERRSILQMILFRCISPWSKSSRLTCSIS